MRPINGWRSFRPPWKLGRYVEIGVVILGFFSVFYVRILLLTASLCAERAFSEAIHVISRD
jgi:hypothetical protein